MLINTTLAWNEEFITLGGTFFHNSPKKTEMAKLLIDHLCHSSFRTCWQNSLFGDSSLPWFSSAFPQRQNAHCVAIPVINCACVRTITSLTDNWVDSKKLVCFVWISLNELPLSVEGLWRPFGFEGQSKSCLEKWDLFWVCACPLCHEITPCEWSSSTSPRRWQLVRVDFSQTCADSPKRRDFAPTVLPPYCEETCVCVCVRVCAVTH